MGIVERWYQQEGADSVVPYFEGDKGNPLVVAPTGAGKTIILAGIIKRFREKYPHHSVLVLSHVKEILEQNEKTLSLLFDDVCVWSASVGRKEKGKITVAGIQSVFRVPQYFKNVGLVIVDECHLVNHKDQGMYRKFLAKLRCAVVGLTATPYRLGHGYIHNGEGTLFTEISYDLSSTDNFNRLVDEGYLAKLITKKTILKFDIEGVRTVAGDFDQGQLSICIDREQITEAAVHEIIRFGQKYKKWLIFAIDIKHAEHIADALNKYGYPTACLHSRMEGGRETEIEKFRRGEYRCMVNVEMLTTGFDVKEIDLIAILRPTKSAVIHVQTIGRGLRPVYSEGYDLETIEGRNDAQAKGVKPHCLVLDFAGNTRRLGPINDIRIKEKGKVGDGGDAIVKECPDCNCYCAGSCRICPTCGFEFKFKEKILSTSGTEDVVKKNKDEDSVPEWVKVDSISYSVKSNKDGVDMLLAVYKCGMLQIYKYVCYDHHGYSKHLAKHWVNLHYTGTDQIVTVKELYDSRIQFKTPTKIHVKKKGKYFDILSYDFTPCMDSPVIIESAPKVFLPEDDDIPF